MTLSTNLPGHLWESTAFALIIAALTLMFKPNRARLRYWMWLAASVKFLIPYLILVSLGSHLGIHLAVQAEKAPAPISTGHFSGESGTGPERRVPARESMDFTPVLYALWASGFSFVLFRWRREWMPVRDALRASTPMNVEIGIPVRSSPACLEPGVFGIFRPVLLLPEGIQERLRPEQLNAILAHEMCHVRLRDNLAAAIQMTVEALFWFHPLVWWIGRRLVDERERACDEEVLLQGSKPQDYAESIVTVCKLYLESPVVCAAGVTGSDLKKRVEGIMANRITRRLDTGRKLLLAGMGIAALTTPIVVGILNAPLRAQLRDLKFEVASMKQVNFGGPPGDIPRNMDGGRGRFAMRNIPLRYAVEWAYDFQDYQIVGPEWIKTDERYEIAATAPPETTEAQMRVMLQNLLLERLQMKVHREKREMSVYALVPGKGPAKVKPAGSGGQPDLSGSPTGVKFASQPLSRLTFLLTRRLGLPVLDETKLPGIYDYTIDVSGLPGRDGNDGPGPSIFQAVQTDLGFRLESKKEAIEVLVIDSVNKTPTPN